MLVPLRSGRTCKEKLCISGCPSMSTRCWISNMLGIVRLNAGPVLIENVLEAIEAVGGVTWCRQRPFDCDTCCSDVPLPPTDVTLVLALPVIFRSDCCCGFCCCFCRFSRARHNAERASDS